MRNVGIFWGIMGVVLTIGSILRFVAWEFYNAFIRGLSKRSHRKLVEDTMDFVKIFEEDHGIFAFGGTVSITLHAIIMTSFNGISILGLIVGIVFGAVMFMGLFHKFIYKDKAGKIKQYHLLFTLIYIIFLMFHLRFG